MGALEITYWLLVTEIISGIVHWCIPSKQSPYTWYTNFAVLSLLFLKKEMQFLIIWRSFQNWWPVGIEETLYKRTRLYIDYLSLWIDYESEISSSSPFIKLHIDLNFVVRVGAFWIRLPCFGAIWSSAHDLLFRNTSQEVMNKWYIPVGCRLVTTYGLPGWGTHPSEVCNQKIFQSRGGMLNLTDLDASLLDADFQIGCTPSLWYSDKYV